MSVEQAIQAIPPTEELREQLSRNVRERALLRELMRLAEKRDRLEKSKQQGAQQNG